MAWQTGILIARLTEPIQAISVNMMTSTLHTITPVAEKTKGSVR